MIWQCVFACKPIVRDGSILKAMNPTIQHSEKLDGSNYPLQKYKMKAILSTYELWDTTIKMDMKLIYEIGSEQCKAKQSFDCVMNSRVEQNGQICVVFHRLHCQ